ncbi:hypothetical protein [Candidatus Magnetaquicoccus inordinatus]|uniref:hypothetical protein n=1 Tax=Candidatus Magnetaquicoccus inordinatus TaxID=2496818 RepID=UPI00102BD42C|nr:hypothetical protein [Candidatus Magnetaquicoccus inordinatus]
MINQERRKFLKIVLSSGACTILPIMPAYAFFPFLLRLFVSSSLRTGISSSARTLTGTALRSAVGGTTARISAGSALRTYGTKTIRGKSWSLLETTLYGSISALDHSLAKEANHAGVTAIWVMDDPHVANSVNMEFVNKSYRLQGIQTYLFLTDKHDDRNSYKCYQGEFWPPPGGPFSYQFPVKDLPYSGIKNVVVSANNIESNEVVLLVAKRRDVLYSEEINS